MSTDQRESVKNLLQTIIVTLDDGLTVADILVMYSGGPETLKYLFNVTDFHVIITIDRPTSRESGDQRRIQDAPLRFNADVPVHVMAIDQTGVTATKVLNKVRLQIEAIIGANSQQTDYTLIIQTERPTNQRIGGYDLLWKDDYVILYRPMVS
jgi:hypothetical protein